jgi:arylsulfatase A-like enzyme
LLTRALLLQEKHLALRPADARGIFADLVVGLLMIGVAGLCLRADRWWSRVLAALLLGSFVVSSFAMYEFISVFDSLYAFSHIGFVSDSTFLGGSVPYPKHPVWLAFLVTAAIASALFGQVPGKAWWRAWGLVLVSSAAAQALIPLSPVYDEWRQRHALEANASILSAAASDEPSAVGADLRHVFRADLRGRRWIEPLGTKTNVLLILVEGASGAYLPSVAAAEGVQSSTIMPRLDALAQNHVLLSRVISHQRQTNRGEYAILCGDYPKLLTDQSKMTEQTYGAAHRCLPAVFRDAGYATVYIQAAPLGFMLKDQFMPKAGFQELIGESWFDRAYARTDWGVDDKAFFEQALERVLDLHRAEQPFFATMLTVGTHHPYTIPDTAPASQDAGMKTSRHDRAFRWADEAITDFVFALERHGVLRDTVVLITSDESSGLSDAENATQKLLSQSWSFVVVLLPEPQPIWSNLLVQQVDTAMSVTDLLGMEREAARFLGRSWFRRYHAPRPLFSANTYARRVMMWEPSGSVVVCGESLHQCTRSVPQAGLVFGAIRHSEPATPYEQRLVTEVARLTRSGRSDLSDSGTLALLTESTVQVRAIDGKKLLVGGQYLRVPASSTLRIDIDLQVEGERAAVEFHQDTFVDGHPKLVRKGIRVESGQRWRLRYEIGVPNDAGQLVVQLYAKAVSGSTSTIRFHRAELTIVPGRMTSEAAVVQLDEVSQLNPLPR